MKSQQQTTAGTNDDEVGNPSDDPEGQLPSTSKAGQSTSSLGINRGGGGRQGDQRTSSRSTNGKSTSLSSESGSSTLGPTSGRSSTSSWWAKIFSFDFDLLIHFEVLKVEMDLIWWYFRVSVEAERGERFHFFLFVLYWFCLFTGLWVSVTRRSQTSHRCREMESSLSLLIPWNRQVCRHMFDVW